ncbi:MAG: regulatory iron-sulfur-containing complex subunit RicT [Syntrophorhabdales bacterium]|jgi:cell fate regulator YaaT (PSP1 superfamily)
MKACRVKFERTTGTVELEAVDDLKIGDQVVCDLDKGECLGVVATEPSETAKEGLRKIVRRASAEEVADYRVLKEKEGYAFDLCKRKIDELKLPMKLLRAEYLLRAAKLLFYFFSEDRVDFRELVKELAKEFKVRIEMRQVGVRDEAKIIGGLGNCGNVVCCKRFLNSFSIVSIKMMKEQNLLLNPSKISGVCGRLMCCLGYEYDMYVELKKEFPKVGKRVMTPQGEAKVIKNNVLNRTVLVETGEGKEFTFAVTDVKPVRSGEI